MNIQKRFGADVVFRQYITAASVTRRAAIQLRRVERPKFWRRDALVSIINDDERRDLTPPRLRRRSPGAHKAIAEVFRERMELGVAETAPTPPLTIREKIYVNLQRRGHRRGPIKPDDGGVYVS